MGRESEFLSKSSVVWRHYFDLFAHKTATCGPYLLQVHPCFDLLRQFESVVTIATEVTDAQELGSFLRLLAWRRL